MKQKKYFDYICILFIAVIAITLFSYSSTLYSFNPWSDANIFLTIGRGILKNKVIYRDLFDHKGPVLFFLYAICALISSHSFLGVYLIEIISLTLFLYFTKKLLEIFTDKNSILFLLALSFIICGSKAFSFGGGSVEEFALPIMQYCNYLIIKRIHNKESFQLKDSIVIGILAAVIFLMKFTLSGFFLGIAVSLVIYQWKTDRKIVFRCILAAISAFLAINLIVLVYFAINDSINFYFESYYLFNLFSYKSQDGILTAIYKMIRALGFYLKNNLVFMALSLTGIIYAFLFFRKEKYIKRYTLILILCWYTVSFIGGVFIDYYILPIGIWLPFCFLCLNKYETKWVEGFGVVLIILTLTLSPNIRHIKDKETVRHSFVSDINQSSFLMYDGYDEGFYLIGNEIPACRIFTDINSANEKMLEERKSCVEKNQIEYLISMNHEITLDGYELIKEETGIYGDQMRDYRLYRRIRK